MRTAPKAGRKINGLPDKPGCYLMRDRRGRIIYVGKASSLRKRVRWYFRESSFRRASPKLRGLMRSIADFDYIVARNEADAILIESNLIKEYKPRYNVSFKDDKRFLLLKAFPNDRFPSLRLCRIQMDDDARYFGPYTSSATARVALDFTEKKFGLRKCSPAVPNEDTYRHCINDIVRYCSAPCVGKIDEAGYRERFDEACAFLRGERGLLLTEVWEAIQSASAKMDFERAAYLRDVYFHLSAAVKRRIRSPKTLEIRREDAFAGIMALRDMLGLGREPRVIEAFDVSNISGTYAVGSMVAAVDGLPKRSRYRRFSIRSGGPDDTRMIAEIVQRRYSRLIAENGQLPDLVLVDGGVTQLGAARKRLDALGLRELPVAALAKKLEDIYHEKSNKPIRLDRSAQALQVLRQIRDEAHRFAIAFHRKARGRRIRDSVLDDAPGIGDERKRRLLEHFGSVKRIAAANAEEIARVPGFGRRSAESLVRFLAVRSGYERKGGVGSGQDENTGG